MAGEGAAAVRNLPLAHAGTFPFVQPDFPAHCLNRHHTGQNLRAGGLFRVHRNPVLGPPCPGHRRRSPDIVPLLAARCLAYPRHHPPRPQEDVTQDEFITFLAGTDEGKHTVRFEDKGGAVSECNLHGSILARLDPPPLLQGLADLGWAPFATIGPVVAHIPLGEGNDAFGRDPPQKFSRDHDPLPRPDQVGILHAVHPVDLVAGVGLLQVLTAEASKRITGCHRYRHHRAGKGHHRQSCNTDCRQKQHVSHRAHYRLPRQGKNFPIVPSFPAETTNGTKKTATRDKLEGGGSFDLWVQYSTESEGTSPTRRSRQGPRSAATGTPRCRRGEGHSPPPPPPGKAPGCSPRWRSP